MPEGGNSGQLDVDAAIYIWAIERINGGEEPGNGVGDQVSSRYSGCFVNYGQEKDTLDLYRSTEISNLEWAHY